MKQQIQHNTENQFEEKVYSAMGGEAKQIVYIS